LANESSAEIFHSVPKRALEAAAEFFGDVVDGDEAECIEQSAERIEHGAPVKDATVK